MYVGTAVPWGQFHQPDTTGITLLRLFGLGILVLLFRRIPALLITYKAMPSIVKNWKEAVFMGYFGPIGVGAIYHLEHTRLLFNPDNPREKALVDALYPGKAKRKILDSFVLMQYGSGLFPRISINCHSRPFYSSIERRL